MAIKHAYSATGSNDDTKQVSVTRWNQDHVIDSEIVVPNYAPLPPAADTIAVFGKKIGGRMQLCQMGPTGLDTSFTPHLGGNKIAVWMPPGGTTNTPGAFGMNALTATGTATTRAVAVTNMLTRMTRLGYVSAATAGSLAGVRETAAKYTTGAGGGLGGFYARYRFGVSDAAAVAGARMFVGLWSSTGAPTNVEINTLTNIIGVCKDSNSNNLQIYGAGASVGSLVDLGANFPANTLSTDAYELAMFSPSNGGGVYWQVTRLNTGGTASGQFASFPASSTLLCHNLWRGNNATALAVGLDICGIYMETDY